MALAPQIETLKATAQSAIEQIFGVEYALARQEGLSPEEAAKAALERQGPPSHVVADYYVDAIEKVRLRAKL